MAPVGRAIRPHQGVHHDPPAGWSRVVAAERGQHVGGQRPHGGGQQRDVNCRAIARPALLEQGGGDPEGQRHSPVAIAHRTALVDRVVAVRRGEDVGEPTSCEERRGVVARLIGVGAPRSEAVAPGVDELRVAGSEGLGVEAEALEGSRADVGQEDVGRFEEPVERLDALGCLEVEGDRPLAAVGECHREVDAALGPRPDPLGDQAAVRVALDALDVDDVGAPVGQQGSRHRHEHPLRQLDDPDPLEGQLAAHAPSPAGVRTTTGILRSVRSW